MTQNTLSIVQNQNTIQSIWENEHTLAQIKRIYGKDLTDDEFRILIQVGIATGLNPFLREIYAISYREKDGSKRASIFIARDGYRRSAQAHPLYDYHISDSIYENDEFVTTGGLFTHKYTLKNRGKLIGAYALVKRKTSTQAIWHRVSFHEYSTGRSLWNEQHGKPETMIKKVAEAQTLRMAFQELFQNTYCESERWDDRHQLKIVKDTRTPIQDERITKMQEFKIKDDKEQEQEKSNLDYSAATIDYDIKIIENCSTIDELKHNFQESVEFWRCKNDREAIQKLIEAKDKKKLSFLSIEQELKPQEEICMSTGEIVNL